MFEMTQAQATAASHAMNELSATTLQHLIIYGIAALNTIWLSLLIISIKQQLSEHQSDLGESLVKLAVGLGIYIATASLIII